MVPTSIIMKIKAQQQGDIKGELIQAGREGYIKVISVNHEITSAIDASTGGVYNNGKLQADLKNYTGAQSLYQRALTINPRDVQVLADLGRVLYNLQNYTGSLHSLDKALTIDPSSVYALEGKAFVMYKLGDYRQALVSADRALELNPLSYSALNTLGIALTKLGDYRQAITAFDAAIAISKTTFTPYPYEFLDYLDKAIALDDKGLHNHDIGYIHLALQSVDKALTQNPDDKSAQGLRTTLEQLLTWHDNSS